MARKIAILVKEFPPDVIGGTETQTKRMARELDGAGHEITVYTKAYKTDQSDDSLPYEVVRVPNWRISPFVSTLTFVLAATFFLLRDAREYNILQCMMIYPNGFIGRVVNTLRGLPYFAWIRGGDYYFMKDTPVKRWMIRSVLREARVLVQTERIAADVRSEFDESSLTVLGNGVDIPSVTAEGDEIVFVGRLKDQKGVDVFLRAVAGLNESVLIVGDGPERENLEALAERLNVDAEFAGEVPPDVVPDYLRRGKLFVLPSVRGEGLPNAVLEAMAVGLPVIVTDTGGAADAVVDGETGYLVSPGDEDALGDRIEQLCRDEDRRERMGEAARAWVVKNHGWETIVDSLEDVYADVTNMMDR
ncbi:glycosyltransferase family 4 protein [Halorubrum ruber]|uniref:Glycosyltransferase family 4 protein n=1 Tax=Halorubrum ruber TaxID=2982524 RepID=A0A8T8LIE8_9EURY|nr:glycosyltransferase family 4 protein [Halorubrum ruber]QUO46919.1 glycosyltransferase family 4 protein [Halorubrum ruber]